MRDEPPSRLVTAFWVTVFFGTGVAIALTLAIPVVDGGKPAALGVLAGAFLGGYGAYFVFFFGIRLGEYYLQRRRQKLPAEIDPRE